MEGHAGGEGSGEDDNMEVEHLVSASSRTKERKSVQAEDQFGAELTNGPSMPGALILSPGKRHVDENDTISNEVVAADGESVDGPPRRKRKSTAPKVIEVEDSDEDAGFVASTPRRSKRRGEVV